MLGKVVDLFRSDEFKPSAAVFPDIDRERIAKELDLRGCGQERGREGQPSSDAKVLDMVEMSAVSRVEELRRRGLETFESHRKAYSERLARATAARMAVEQGTRDAVSKFRQTVIEYQAMMVTPQEELREAFNWREQFRRKHRLGSRPARPALGWGAIIGIGLVMIVIESVLNSYLFSQSNPLGLVGGLIAAILVSAANVSISTGFGMAGKTVNSRRFFWKLAGLLLCLGFVGFVGIYNLAVAHFRDAVESMNDWREASAIALQTLVEDPIGLANLESWLLLVVGCFISIVAFVKGFLASDPYPGYSGVSQAVTDARANYIQHLQESNETLEQQRDDAVGELLETSEEIQRQINDSVDALFGQSHLVSSASAFFEQCDIAVNYLLSVYRDSNKSARETDPPEHFAETFEFERIELKPVDVERRDDAEREVNEINSLISKATREIYAAYDEAVDAHRNIDELQGTEYARPRKQTPPSLTSLKVVDGSSEQAESQQS
ncbi:hypothetical protein [Rhodosalinus sediminis]|uniref:hypothetical protein n=1 Tax=Rhodosalinus sediminis TaxID=1940533 RepID=UPI000E24406C|nr:hypothetical protein [Rhodosalinus sediminis]